MEIISTYILPGFLFWAMLCMGMTLSFDDFKRVATSPLQTFVALTVQILITPLLAFIIAIVLQLNTYQAVGLIILAACPGGAVSNVFTHLARADTALSITLTALSSIVTVFTIPFIINFGLDYFASESVHFHLPVIKTIISIFLFTVFPLIMGMLIKIFLPIFSSKSEPILGIILVIIILVGLTGILIIVSNQKLLFDDVLSIGVSVFLLSIILLVFGYCIGGLFKFKQKQKITIGIESCTQNVVLGITIAVSPQLLNNPLFGISSGIYAACMCVSCTLVIFWARKLMRQKS